MLILFWFAIFMVFYAYAGYPLSLMMISVFRNREGSVNAAGANTDQVPKVSFIITAYNEENQIREKIANSLAQEYPKDKLEIIVASDCSSDRTDEIVSSYERQGVRLVRAPERKGKENAQHLAVEAANGEYLVFSDVATTLEPNGISSIIANFSDPTVGCVSSEDKFISQDGNLSGEGAYVRYEMFLRRLESRVNTVVGLSGSFFAAKRQVCKNWSVNLQSDFNTLLNSVKLGLRGISDPASIGYYKNIKDEKREFDRKVRTVLRGLSVFSKNLYLLNPKRYGLFSWQLFSHKLCRWLVPFFLLLAFFANAALMFSSFFFAILFLGQIFFYFLAAYYYFTSCSSVPVQVGDSTISLNKNSKLKIKNYILSLSKLAYYFVVANASIFIAWIKYLSGKRAVLWEPSKR